MESFRPRTYNELMCYIRCQRFVGFASGIEGDYLAQIHSFIREDPAHRVVAESGELTFRKGEEVIRSVSIGASVLFAKIELTSTALNTVAHPHLSSSHSSSGTGSNNNNNNNNNNG